MRRCSTSAHTTRSGSQPVRKSCGTGCSRARRSDHASMGCRPGAWASMRSLRPKVEHWRAAGAWRQWRTRFHGEKRSNETNASTADPDVRLYRKGPGYRPNWPVWLSNPRARAPLPGRGRFDQGFIRDIRSVRCRTGSPSPCGRRLGFRNRVCRLRRC